jgi:MFS transporter, AAHS family, 4-hydroxybenzoate transporter
VATALGWVGGMGRVGGFMGGLLGGLMIAAGWTNSTIFFVIALPLLLCIAGVVVLWVERRRRAGEAPDADHADGPMVATAG